jgi:hypothetical protein
MARFRQVAVVFKGGKVTKFAISGKIVVSPMPKGCLLRLTLRDGQHVDGESVKVGPGVTTDLEDEGGFQCAAAAIAPTLTPLQILSYRAVDHCKRVPLSIQAQVRFCNTPMINDGGDAKSDGDVCVSGKYLVTSWS